MSTATTEAPVETPVKPAKPTKAKKSAAPKAEKPQLETKPENVNTTGEIFPVIDQPLDAQIEPAKPLVFTSRMVKLDDLSFSHKIQPRQSLDKQALADYVEIFAAAKEKGAESPFPALRAVKRHDAIIIFSGFTRGAAAKKAGVTEHRVEIAENNEITDAELFRLAIEANAEHGARFTNADKIHNFNKVLKFPEYSGLSNVQLAEMVGVSEFFIRKHRPKTATSTRTGKGGKQIDTSRIGKGGGKSKPAKAVKPGEAAAAAAQNLAENTGPIEGQELGLTGTESTAPTAPPAARFDAETEKALDKVCITCNGHEGFTAEGIRDAVLDGTLKLSNGDIKLWAQTSEGRIRKIAPLVVNLRWTPKAAFAHIDKQIDSKTKVEHLINSAIATGGATKRNSIMFGEVISDNPDFSVMVYDTRKFRVSVELLDQSSESEPEPQNEAPEPAQEKVVLDSDQPHSGEEIPL